ncbi:hypothetical protein D6C78_05913 [Aureobasidium pullulans]|uniref:Pre-SET domain-containing protein n=1 Tax=Aureobasidium pullulans TaxID=5580 RepID=A0A4T0BME1_AURPU|nr:hypothetical protein D6C78_05913 [Aureobasidium pullulans]
MKFSTALAGLIAIASALPISTPDLATNPDHDIALLALVQAYLTTHQPNHTTTPTSSKPQKHFFQASILPNDTRIRPERYDEKDYPPKKCDEHICCAETRCWRISPPQVTVNATVMVDMAGMMSGGCHAGRCCNIEGCFGGPEK